MQKTLLAAAMGLLLASAAFPLRAAEPLCDRSGSKTTASPDGHWITNVQEEVCATANGAAAGITVVLVSAADPQVAKRVFIMPVPRSRDDWPQVRWQGSQTMELRVPNLSEAPSPDPEYQGIRIVLTHCGDNPDDRARLVAYREDIKQWQKDVTAWAARRKQDADAAGPRPDRPEEPRLPPGRCSD